MDFGKNLQLLKQKLIKVWDLMVWVSQEQPAARSGQEKSQLQPGEPAASSQQPAAARSSQRTSQAARKASQEESQPGGELVLVSEAISRAEGGCERSRLLGRDQSPYSPNSFS